MIYLEDIVLEQDASDAVTACEISAIEASEALTNKRNRIQRAERDIKCLMKLCVLRKWKEPQDALQSMLDKLGDAKRELQINLWSS